MTAFNRPILVFFMIAISTATLIQSNRSWAAVQSQKEWADSLKKYTQIYTPPNFVAWKTADLEARNTVPPPKPDPVIFDLEKAIQKIQSDFEKGIQQSKDKLAAGASSSEAAAQQKKSAEKFEQDFKQLQTLIDQSSKSLEEKAAARKKVDTEKKYFEDTLATTEKNFADAAAKINMKSSALEFENATNAVRIQRQVAEAQKGSIEALNPKYQEIDQHMSALEAEMNGQAQQQMDLSEKITAAQEAVAKKLAEAQTSRSEATQIATETQAKYAEAKMVSAIEFAQKMKDQVFETKILLANWETVSAKFGAQKEIAELHYTEALNNTLLSRYIDGKIKASEEAVLKQAKAVACSCSQTHAAGLGPASATGTSKSILEVTDPINAPPAAKSAQPAGSLPPNYRDINDQHAP